MAEIEAGVVDVKADYPDLSDDDIYHDLALNVMYDCTPAVRHSVARSFLGWDSEEDMDLYVRHDIPLSSDEYP